MGLYEQIKTVAKDKGYSINRLEKELGFARSSISKFNKNIPSTEKIIQIADKLNVPVTYLMDMPTGVCLECGLSYDPSYPDDVKYHETEHAAWKKASEKYGKLYCYHPERERIKAENRAISHDTSRTIEERCAAQLTVLRCLFSRSVLANNFDLKHVSFDEYVSMMLGNESYRKYNLENDIYNVLVKKYGISPGIPSGTVYHISPTESTNTTMAAHLDGKDFTEEQWNRIESFAKFIKQEDSK